MGTKNKEKGSFLQKIYFAAILFLAFLFVLSFVKNLEKARKIEKIVLEKETKIKQMETKKEEVEKRLVEAKSEAYVEKRLRDDLGMAKEGETIFVLPDESILRSLVPPLPQEEDSLPDPIWKKWLRLFEINI
jgi:cell division protein FtsB